MINKVVNNIESALKGVESNMTFMFGGFGLSGIPENSITALSKKDIFGLTCISNTGVDDFGLELLLKRKQIKKMISSYVGENGEFERQMLLRNTRGGFNSTRKFKLKDVEPVGAGIPLFFTPPDMEQKLWKGKRLESLTENLIY